jgi:hypothetical protein
MGDSHEDVEPAELKVRDAEQLRRYLEECHKHYVAAGDDLEEKRAAIVTQIEVLINFATNWTGPATYYAPARHAIYAIAGIADGREDVLLKPVRPDTGRRPKLPTKETSLRAICAAVMQLLCNDGLSQDDAMKKAAELLKQSGVDVKPTVIKQWRKEMREGPSNDERSGTPRFHRLVDAASRPATMTATECAVAIAKNLRALQKG